jgi:uncharacterized protein (DUF488 family)
MKIYTIGHSTRSLEELIAMLQGHSIQRLVDVRTMPRSRHNPQFNTDTLPTRLAAVGIAYTHMAGLGGLRPQRKNSINLGWHNASFRAYADYMQTEEFAENIQQAIEMGSKERIALMCAEAVPWRCHRSLVADALLVRGIQVEEIITPEKSEPHQLTPFASVDGTCITYPSDQPTTGQLF